LAEISFLWLQNPKTASFTIDFAVRIANGSLIPHLWHAPKLPAAVHRIRALRDALEDSEGSVALEAETNVLWKSSSKETDEVKYIESVSVVKREGFFFFAFCKRF